MLPPVRTMSGSSGSYQSSSSVTAIAHLTGVPIFPGQAADQERDTNSNLSGRLNVLLLAGRDVVAEDLSMLADVLGKVVDLPRRSGETSAVYVRRLAEALAGLPSEGRSEADRQLDLIIRGIRLDFVIKAFLNPTGPQAARIVALLEMAGSKSGDLATQSVLTSYRQHEGGDLPPGFDSVGPLSASVSLAPSVPATRPGAPASASPTKATSVAVARDGSQPAAGGSISAAGPMSPILAEEFDDEPERINLHTETGNIFSRTSSDPPRNEGGAAFAVPLTDARANRSRQTALASPDMREVDARRLSAITATAFDAGDNADPVIQAKAAIELLASAQAGPDPSAPTGRILLRAEEPLLKPFIDYTRPPPRPALQPEVRTALLVLEGLSEIETIGLSLLQASLEADAVLTSALSPHAVPKPDMPESAYNLRGRGIPANDDRHRSALAAAEQQLLRNADEAAGLAADRRIEQAPSQITQIAAATRTGTDAFIAQALQIGYDPRPVTGYAGVPYPPVDERDEEEPPRPGYRSRSGSDDADEDEADRRDKRSGKDATGEAGTLRAGTGESRLSEDASETDDPAFDYYQRMAGWN